MIFRDITLSMSNASTNMLSVLVDLFRGARFIAFSINFVHFSSTIIGERRGAHALSGFVVMNFVKSVGSNSPTSGCCKSGSLLVMSGSLRASLHCIPLVSLSASLSRCSALFLFT